MPALSRRADPGWPKAAYAVIGAVLGVVAVVCLYILWRGPNRKLFPWTKSEDDKMAMTPPASTIADDKTVVDDRQTLSDRTAVSDPASWRGGASTEGVVLPMRKMSLDPNGGEGSSAGSRVSLPSSPFPTRPKSATSPELVAPRAVHAAGGGLGGGMGMPGMGDSPASPTSPTSSFQNFDASHVLAYQTSPPGSIYSMQSGLTPATSPPPNAKRRSARRSNGSLNAPPIPSPLGLGISGNEILDPLREETSFDTNGTPRQVSSGSHSHSNSHSSSQGSSPTKSRRSVSFINSSPPRDQSHQSLPPKARPVMMPLDSPITGADMDRKRATPPLPPGAGAPNPNGQPRHDRTSWQTHTSRRSSSSSHHLSSNHSHRRPVYPDPSHTPTLPNVYSPEAFGPNGFVSPRVSHVPPAHDPRLPRGLWADSAPR